MKTDISYKFNIGIKNCFYFVPDLDGSANSLTERRKAGPPENTTTYTVSV